jgi:hypothetical protein
MHNHCPACIVAAQAANARLRLCPAGSVVAAISTIHPLN